MAVRSIAQAWTSTITELRIAKAPRDKRPLSTHFVFRPSNTLSVNNEKKTTV